MYNKFEYIPGSFYNSEINRHLQSGQQRYDATKEKSHKCLSNFISADGSINGSALKEHWFQLEKFNVFLSHSHSDLYIAQAFAGWLYDKFNLTCFIDSCIWGHCDDLLKEIDDAKCKLNDGKTYDYQRRNYSTSHVHMMLSTALTEMIDKSECIIFLNTPNSICLSGELEKIKKGKKRETLSPWIYHELAMTSMIRVTEPQRLTEALEHRATHYDHVDIKHGVGKYLDEMITLTDDMLRAWNSSGTTGTSALAQLYSIAKPSGNDRR